MRRQLPARWRRPESGSGGPASPRCCALMWESMARTSNVAGTARAAEPRYGELVSQYLELRNQHSGVLLLFRVGSFYEVLFEDAELVARELGLKLSERPSSGSAPPVPQCGFAHHALDAFLLRLLGRGYRVAVCEESETPTNGRRERSVVRT